MTLGSHLSCSRCGRSHAVDTIQNTCTTCDAPLLVEYDLAGIGSLKARDIARRPPTMWRYRELLPVPAHVAPVSLGEGMTPLLPMPALGELTGVRDLWVKDEGLNPTGTFKARGAACGVTMAQTFGVTDVVLPTAGNAGVAWACYGAAAGIKLHVVMPADAPTASQDECRLLGADLELVEGTIAEATVAATEHIRERGWFDASTLREPYRIEGKKTLGLEIAEQLGWQAPDVIVYPAGGGVGLIGIWRAFRQLLELGWVEHMPRLSIVQAEGCAPLVRAFERGWAESERWKDSRTIAAGLRVPKPLGDALCLRAIRETGGAAVAVADPEILDGIEAFARSSGMLACPEGAATLPAVGRLRARGDIDPGERVVLVNTGSAAKAPEAVRALSARSREIGRSR